MLFRHKPWGFILFLQMLLTFVGTPSYAKPAFPVFGYLPDYDATGPFPSDGAINLSDNTKFPWDRLTHVVEGFAQPSSTGVLSFPDGQRANLVFKAHQNNTRAVLSVGGAGSNLGNWGSATGASKANFIYQLTSTASTQGYDGIDIDWEFPTVGQMAQFTTFMQQLGAAIHAQTSACGGCVFQGAAKQLTFFGSPGNDICGVDWNNSTLQNAVDYCIVGGYDFNAGPGYNGPISDPSPYTDCRGVGSTLCLTRTVNTLTAGVGGNFSWPISKLILAMPMYTMQNSAGFTKGTPALVVLRNGAYQSYSALAGEARYTLSGSNQYVTTAQGYCDKMNFAFGKGMPGFALWEITHLYPANDVNAAPIWDTIEGIASCINRATPTPGPTPNTVPAGLVEMGYQGDYTNDWNGVWGTYAGTGGSSITLTANAPGYASSPYNGTGPYSIQGSGVLGTGAPSASTNLKPAAAQYNLDSNGYNRLDFWFKATPGSYRIGMDRQAIRSAAPTPNDQYGITFDVPDNNWHAYSFYLIDMAQEGWGSTVARAYTDVIAIFIRPTTLLSGTAFSFNVDDLELVKDPVTPTITPTPAADLIDTVEDGNAVNNYGGQWTTYNPGGTGDSISMATKAPGYPFSSYGYKYSVRIQGTNGTDSNPPTFSTILGAAGYPNYTPKDVSAWNFLTFYAASTGTSGTFTMSVQSKAGGIFTRSFSIPTDGSWNLVQIPMTAAGWNYSYCQATYTCTAVFSPTDLQVLTWFTTTAGAFNLSLDDLDLKYIPPTPTPTLTASPTQSATPSATPSGTPSATPSVSPSNSPSATPSASATVTANATFSSTGTPSPSASGTASATRTPSASPSRTGTATATTTNTVVLPSFTSTNTPLPGSTFTDTSTISPTFSRTATASPSVTLSFSQTNTTVPTATPSTTPTASRTVTVVVPSFTSTNTPLPGSSFTDTSTVSPTFSASATISPSVTLTLTPSDTVIVPSFTSTNTPLPGSSFTDTSTVSPSMTETMTSTPSNTASVPTSTSTSTNTKTLTPSLTPTQTPNTAMIQDVGPMSWGPTSITVSVGTTVTWGWAGFHSVQSTTASEPYSSGGGTLGGSFAHQFSTAGDFTFDCGVHGVMMSGFIHVAGSAPATPTPTGTPGHGPLAILGGAAVNNPSPSQIRVLLSGPADKLDLRIYTVSLRCVLALSLPISSNGGWVAIPLPLDYAAGLGQGAYYCQVTVHRGEVKGLKPWLGKFVLLK